MIPRLFIGNFDFEHRLAEPNRQTPAHLRRLNAELATVWLSIARDRDWIWTPEPIDAEFFRQAVREGLPQVFPAVSLSDVPKDVECVPWGWSAEIRALVDQYGWRAHAPPDSAVRKANSRATSDELERRWDIGLRESRRIESLNDLNSAIRALDGAKASWVVKAEFGMSARERILGRGTPTSVDENWLRRRLTQQSAVFFEPWVERIGEIGIQIEIPETGRPQLIGVAPMLVDGRGQYAGSWFAFNDSRFCDERHLWPTACDIALQAATELQSAGYFGPLGIDAMIYRDQAGTPQLRALQDINARWTMGRIGLGWNRLLDLGDEGCWQRSIAKDLTGFKPSRIVGTSPSTVGSVSCFQTSRVLIRASH